jgi:hypothetical protein
MSTALRAALFVCVFAVVGPPVGGVVAWLMMGARSLRSPLPFITGAYGEAIWIAIGTGLICCAALLLRKSNWLVPIAAALVVTALAIAVSALVDPPRGDVIVALAHLTAVFAPPAIAAALVCWLIARPLLRDDT